MAYSPFKMKGHTLPGIKQKQSPAKQKADTTKTYSLKDKTFPPEYTKKDIKFLEEQREDIVRRSDFPEGSKEQKMFDANQAKIKAKKAKEAKKKSSPGKWVQFIPMALSAVSAVSKMAKRSQNEEE